MLFCFSFIIPPPQNVCVWGGYTGFALSRRSVGQSISNSCPLYNSFTNGRISFKLEWHIHLNQIFNKQILHIMSCLLYTVHSTRIPHFPQNFEENLSFARKLTEDNILVIHKILWSSAELIKFLRGNLEQ